MKSCGRCPHEKHQGYECGIIIDELKGFRCGCNEAKRAAVLKLRELSGVLFSIFGPPPPSLQQQVRNAEVMAENAIMDVPGRVRNGRQEAADTETAGGGQARATTKTAGVPLRS